MDPGSWRQRSRNPLPRGGWIVSTPRHRSLRSRLGIGMALSQPLTEPRPQEAEHLVVFFRTFLVLFAPLIGVAAAGGDVRLADAVMNGDTETVQTLLKLRVDVDAPQADGTTALDWAVRRDNLETADLLIHAGANVKATNRYG